jgi:hypothetical protein
VGASVGVAIVGVAVGWGNCGRGVGVTVGDGVGVSVAVAVGPAGVGVADGKAAVGIAVASQNWPISGSMPALARRSWQRTSVTVPVSEVQVRAPSSTRRWTPSFTRSIVSREGTEATSRLQPGNRKA